MVGAAPVCPPVSPHEGASIDNGCASCAMHKHFCGWKRLLCGWGMCLLRMETPLRGRSGGHTGAAPTISRVVPCSKVASKQFADGLKREKVAGEVFADGLKREKVAGEQFADGQNRKKVVGEQFAADNPRCLSQENSSPPIFRAVYRRKGARRRYSALFIAEKQFAADIPRCLSQENSSPPIIRAVYRRKRVRRCTEMKR